MIATSRKRMLATIAATGAAALVLVGCGNAPEAGENGSKEGSDNSDFLACAVSDEGSWNDKSFNQVSMLGLTEAEKGLGIKINDAESKSEEDYTPNLEAMVAKGCDITFAVGFKIVEQINAAATENPDSNFVIIDSEAEGHDNLKGMTWETTQSAFLAGYLSAAYSESKVIGTYGGMNIPAVTDFMVGFTNGAKYYEEETGTKVTVLGWDADKQDGDFVGDFENGTAAKSISEGQIEAGADVIMPVAGGLFGATSEAIKESGKDIVMIGVDLDIAKNSPQYADQILTSVEKQINVSIYDVIESAKDGSFSSDGYVGTLENDGTRLSPFYEFEDKIDASIIEKLDELKKKIIAGEVETR